MGYTIVPAEGIIGLGVSAISDINGSIYQNTTEINLYEESLNKNELPVVRYLVRTDEDKTRGLIIEQLMCFSQASIDTREKRKILESSYQYLWPFIQDQLVIVTENMIEVPESGRLFLRNIASAFDQYLHNKEAGKRFSQAV